MITDDDLKNWFTHHAPDISQLPKYRAIREAGAHLARVIVDCTPECADQTAAVRKVREAVITANAAIACNELE